TFWTNSINSSPSDFSLLTPLDDEVIDTTTITFNWEASEDVDLNDSLSYQLEFGESIDSLLIVYLGADTTYTLSDLNDNTTYYWKVIAEDLTGLSTENINGYHSFRINTENDNPEAFSLINPENGAMVSNLLPTFTWEIPIDLDDRNRNRFIESYQFILNQDTSIVTENSIIPETPLAEDMEYTWQVIAVDNDGGETSSNTWTFWTNSINSSPSDFSLLTPLDDEETGLTPAFSWMESTDLDLYDSLIYTLKLGDDISNLAGINLGNSTNYSLEIELLDNTQYFWQVIATDGVGATFMTPLHSFMVNSENDNPDGFSLLNPQNNETLTHPNEILFWDVSTDLDGDEINYILYLDQNVDPITVIDTIQTNYYQNLQIVEDELYFWKVVSIDENGGSTATEIWSFSLNEINEPPSEFSLISPEIDEIVNTVNVQFDWDTSIDNDFNDIVSYILEIGSNIENLDTVNVGFDTSYIIEELNDNTEYYWRITAIDNLGTSTINSGGFNQFTINVSNDPPSDFSLITPTYESIESNLAPLFYWANSIDNDPEDIVSYELFIDMDSSFVITDPIELDSNGFDYSLLNTVLNDNSEYYWKVNAKDLENETTTSDRFLFYTDSYPEPPNAFNLVSPINDSHLDSNIIEFTWNSTTDNDPRDNINYGFVYTDNLLDTLSFNYVTDLLDTSLTLELETGRVYYWQVIAMDDDSLFTFANGHQDSIWSFALGELSVSDKINIPTEWSLAPAYPNPFNPITNIKFAVPENALISVIIYDINGRVIEVLADGMVNAGFHNLTWDSGNNPSGLYFVKLDALGFSDTQKLMLVK
ncbi:MAG: T9SS type A sorting domain-containing protein, partial [Candidatus Marinimicrobia bacterium]|nr:T9SS type A sorting domain-containing protein [Candidatus Neomarinimicrobiota bacterium]